MSGISASSGIAIGTVFLFQQEAYTVRQRTIQSVDDELQKLTAAKEKTAYDIEQISKKLAQEGQELAAQILAVQVAFLEDQEFYGRIVTEITHTSINAELAIERITEDIGKQFLAVEDDLFQQRIADVQEVAQRLIAHLTNTVYPSLQVLPKSSVLVTSDLLPSQIATLDRKTVCAICTEHGSINSHTALLAQEMNIPAIVGCGTLPLQNGEQIIVNATKGIIIQNPDSAAIRTARRMQKQELVDYTMLVKMAQEPVQTTDGKSLQILANITEASEVQNALTHGAEGIGLLRSEIIYLSSHAIPKEELQYELFCDVARAMPNLPITLRLLDAGGEKPLPFLKKFHADEQNPSLGVRGYRLLMRFPELLQIQLRALLRAAAQYNIAIMAPFITTVDELRHFLSQIKHVKQQLHKQKIAYNEKTPIGIMVEIPSCAITIESYLPHIDFISIGANDLIQYTLAADRTNEHVDYLANNFEPSVLILIDRVLQAARRAKKVVSMCGEMAGDCVLLPLLLGMGLTSYSMSAVRIPRAKEILRSIDVKQCQSLRDSCLQKATATEIKETLLAFAQEHTLRT